MGEMKIEERLAWFHREAATLKADSDLVALKFHIKSMMREGGLLLQQIDHELLHAEQKPGAVSEKRMTAQ